MIGLTKQKHLCKAVPHAHTDVYSKLSLEMIKASQNVMRKAMNPFLCDIYEYFYHKMKTPIIKTSKFLHK